MARVTISSNNLFPGPKGQKGDTGAQGPSGIIAVTSPITNSGSSTSATIGIDQSLIGIAQSQVTNLTSDLAGKAGLTLANTFTAAQTATSFIVTGSTIPANGVYLPAANTLGFATNSAVRVQITSDGSTTFASPIVGFVGTGGSYLSTATANYNIVHLGRGMIAINGTTGGDYNIATNAYYASGWKYYESYGATVLNYGSGKFDFQTAASGTAGNAITFTSKMVIANTGTVTINGFTSGIQGLIVKGAASQTANLQEWQNSAGTIVARIGSGGFFQGTSDGQVAGVWGIGGAAASGVGQLVVYNGTAARVATVIRGAASQTADLQQWQDSTGTVLGSITSAGALKIGTSIAGVAAINNIVTTTAIVLAVRGIASQTADLQQWQNSAGTVLARFTSAGNGAIPRLIVGDAAYSSLGTLGVYAGSASTVGTIIRGAASQTANLQEWQNSTGTILARVSSDGIIISGTIQTTSALAQLSEENSGGRFRLTKATAAGSNPGTDVAKIYLRDGTNAGTLKLVVRAGTAGAETTILDNIPQT